MVDLTTENPKIIVPRFLDLPFELQDPVECKTSSRSIVICARILGLWFSASTKSILPDKKSWNNHFRNFDFILGFWILEPWEYVLWPRDHDFFDYPWSNWPLLKIFKNCVFLSLKTQIYEINAQDWSYHEFHNIDSCWWSKHWRNPFGFHQSFRYCTPTNCVFIS